MKISTKRLPFLASGRWDAGYEAAANAHQRDRAERGTLNGKHRLNVAVGSLPQLAYASTSVERCKSGSPRHRRASADAPWFSCSQCRIRQTALLIRLGDLGCDASDTR